MSSSLQEQTSLKEFGAQHESEKKISVPEKLLSVKQKFDTLSSAMTQSLQKVSLDFPQLNFLEYEQKMLSFSEKLAALFESAEEKLQSYVVNKAMELISSKVKDEAVLKEIAVYKKHFDQVKNMKKTPSHHTEMSQLDSIEPWKIPPQLTQNPSQELTFGTFFEHLYDAPQSESTMSVQNPNMGQTEQSIQNTIGDQSALQSPENHPPQRPIATLEAIQTRSGTRRVERNPNRERAASKLTTLQEKLKNQESEVSYPVETMLSDSDKIEGQVMDFIHQNDRTIASFKLTAPTMERLHKEVLSQLPEEIKTREQFGFRSAKGTTSELADGIVLHIDDSTRVIVSTGERKQIITTADFSKPLRNADGDIIGYEEQSSEIVTPSRALMGSVRIEVQSVQDPEEVTKKVEDALSALQLSEALSSPDALAEQTFKEARYRWQHRLTDDAAWNSAQAEFQSEHQKKLLDTLQRKEVFSGYSTIVEEGAIQRYEKEGRIFLTHRLMDLDVLPNILQDGLLSSHERFQRGIFTQGMSTDKDFATGGADNVFLRAIPESKQETIIPGGSLLIDSKVLERTDWYAYDKDLYGTTEEFDFAMRPSPEQFFETIRANDKPSNEIMMRRGIPTESIKAIVALNDFEKQQIIQILTKAGMTEVNGIPLNEFILVGNRLKEVKDKVQ